MYVTPANAPGAPVERIDVRVRAGAAPAVVAAGRVAEFTALRPAGATRARVLRLAAVEALTVVAAGALLGLLVTFVTPAGTGAALRLLAAPVVAPVPWGRSARRRGRARHLRWPRRRSRRRWRCGVEGTSAGEKARAPAIVMIAGALIAWT
ncbi:hypothetical protein AB0907_06940 [Streptomyces sp. NPDC006975]|uniref:hypothetical protein n=1 Tax=Streptomyces sp. NPDC006975 TaxID=3154310 RepID=UPI003452DD31